MIAKKTSALRERPETSEELLNAAERLFAERGVENVALTEIVIAASQRNRSAVHYHFGSRHRVLTAVLSRRLEAINARREAALDALPYRPSLAQVLRAAIVALAEVVEKEPWGPDYIAILAQVTYHPNFPGRQAVDDALFSGLRRARRLVSQAAPHIPVEVIGRRMDWITATVVFALAHRLRETPAKARPPAEALIDDLTAYGAAALSAPPPQGPECAS
jgi:AcrR family transcriptional regulator